MSSVLLNDEQMGINNLENKKRKLELDEVSEVTEMKSNKKARVSQLSESQDFIRVLKRNMTKSTELDDSFFEWLYYFAQKSYSYKKYVNDDFCGLKGHLSTVLWNLLFYQELGKKNQSIDIIDVRECISGLESKYQKFLEWCNEYNRFALNNVARFDFYCNCYTYYLGNK